MKQPLRLALPVLLAACSVGGAYAIAATRATPPALHQSLDDRVPRQIGEWTRVPTAQAYVGAAVQGTKKDDSATVYDQLSVLTYQNPAGEQVTLLLAYRRLQGHEEKIHQPELCYFAQGYSLLQKGTLPVPSGGAAPIQASTFLAVSPQHVDQVVYWIRLGNRIVSNPTDKRYAIFAAGLHHRIDDGLLVRASIDARGASASDTSAQKAILQSFLAAVVEKSQKAFLIGDA